jgi:hypothetical protein
VHTDEQEAWTAPSTQPALKVAVVEVVPVSVVALVRLLRVTVSVDVAVNVEVELPVDVTVYTWRTGMMSTVTP